MHSPLLSLDADVLQDLQIVPTFTQFFPCVRCGIDITDFTEEEVASHRQFHRYLDEEPKSIPHQDPRPKHEPFPRQSSSGWDWR
jgi:hypothetical protein